MSSNGIVIDLNRISRRDFRVWREGREAADDKGLWDAEHLSVKVIKDWPYDEPVTLEGYQNLGILDALDVDEAISEALISMAKKKLET